MDGRGAHRRVWTTVYDVVEVGGVEKRAFTA
jgi:hypothetical protein